MIDNRTPRLGLLLPDADNYLEDDVVRLSESMAILDGKVATVDGNGKIPVDQIPAVAITDTFTVNTQAAMLALNAQPGDVAIRSDISKTFILMEAPATTLSNWKELVNDALVQLAQPDGYLKVGGLDKQYGNIANTREQWRRQLADAGLNLVAGSFEEGATANAATDAVWHVAGGQCYTWGGSLAKTVPAGSTPESTGGISFAAWQSVNGKSTLDVLAKPSGTLLVGHDQDEFSGTVNAFLSEAVKFVTPNMGFASLKACCEYASENNIELVKLPAGTFDVTGLINVTGTLRVEGAGIGKTIIRQLSSATDGVFNHTLNSAGDAIGYEGFTIQTQKAYSASNYGIRVDMRAQLSGTEIANRTRYRGYIRDIEIAGSYTRSDGIGFGACIDLISTGWVDLERLRLSGCATAGTQYDMKGVGILQRGDGKPVETRITGVRAYNFEYAYLCPEYTEGVYFTDSLAVNCKWGAVVSPVSEWIIGTLGQVGCYQFNVDQFHANVSMGAVFISGTKYSSVTNVMLILDDHSQTSSIVGVHMRNGYGNTVKNIQEVFYNVDGTTGITRQALVVNGVTDSFFENINARTESTTYENITQVVRLVNNALRNRFRNVSGINADTGFSIAAGCGNNGASEYRFQNVATPFDDQAGDFNRGNVDSRYVTFTPTAGSASYTLKITPREYFSRRPNGVSASITSPTTLAFPVDVFYDYASSTATSVVFIIKPTASGNTLPAVLFGVSINMKD